MKLKVGIVGCGKIADGHVEELRKMPDAKVVAVCDREVLMAEQLAVRFDIDRHYGDFAELLDKERPDVIHVTTPPQTHLPLAVQAMDAGCHVYVEKPFTLNLKETDVLLDHAKKTDRKVTVGHSFQFDPIAVAMRRLADEGVVGDVVHVDSYLGYNLSGPFGAALLGDADHWVHRLPGKLFHNNLDHIIHKITEFVTDDEPAVHAFGVVRREARFGDGRDAMPDELRATIVGRRATGYATFSSHVQPLRHFARIYGTRNILTLDYALRTLTIDQAERLPSAIGRLLPPFSEGWQHYKAGWKNVYRFARNDYHFFAGMGALFRRFHDWIREGGEAPIAYSDIRRVVGIMDRIFAQLEAGGEAR